MNDTSSVLDTMSHSELIWTVIHVFHKWIGIAFVGVGVLILGFKR